jgi:hypothetical protein
MKTYLGMDEEVHVLLTSTLVGDEWLASRPGRFTPEERAAGTHWIGGWVDPRDELDGVEKGKFLIVAGLELRSLGRPARSPLVHRLRHPCSKVAPLHRKYVPLLN